MPQDTKSIVTPDTGDFAQGQVYDGTDPARLAAALDAALDYRGDVTITVNDGGGALAGRSVTGYLFDRVRGAEPGVRILLQDSSERVTLADRHIARLEVSGRDTAAGKTFENWIKRYVEKKLAGEEASIYE